MPGPRIPPHLRRGEIIAGISALVLLILIVAVGWLATGPAGHRFHPNAFSAFPVLRWFLLVSVALGLLVAILQATSPAPALPVAFEMIAVTVGGLTTLLLVIRLLLGSGDVAAGGTLGVLACAALTAGAFMALREEDGWIPGPDHPVETIRIGTPPGPSTPPG